MQKSCSFLHQPSSILHIDESVDIWLFIWTTNHSLKPMFITWCRSWQFVWAVSAVTRAPRWWCRWRNSKPEPPQEHTNWTTTSSKASLMVMFQPLPPYLGQVIGLKKAHQSIYGKIEQKYFVDKRQFVHFPKLPGNGDSNWGTAVPSWLSQPHQKLFFQSSC